MHKKTAPCQRPGNYVARPLAGAFTPDGVPGALYHTFKVCYIEAGITSASGFYAVKDLQQVLKRLRI